MTRPCLLLTLAVALAGASTGAHAAAPKPKPAKPVAVHRYLHGTKAVGEAENPGGTGTFMVMDATAPTGSSARSAGVPSYGAGPNTQCAGSSLFPVWVGAIAGVPTGAATVTLFATASPGALVDVRLFGGVDAQACNADYPTPIAAAESVALPSSGKIDVVFTKVNPKAKRYTVLMLQISPSLGTGGLTTPMVARINYDAASANAGIALLCLPDKGKKAC